MTDITKTEIAVILDRSGSMEVIRRDMQGGFQSLVRKQRDAAGTCVMSLCRFDDAYDVVFDERGKLIGRQEREYNWRFMFLGADAASVEEARGLGVRAVAQYDADSAGVERMYERSSEALSTFRQQRERGNELAQIVIDEDLRAST